MTKINQTNKQFTPNVKNYRLRSITTHFPLPKTRSSYIQTT